MKFTTEYNDIKHISEPLVNGYNLVRGTNEEVLDFIESNTNPNISYTYSMLESTNYTIAVIHKDKLS